MKAPALRRPATVNLVLRGILLVPINYANSSAAVRVILYIPFLARVVLLDIPLMARVLVILYFPLMARVVILYIILHSWRGSWTHGFLYFRLWVYTLWLTLGGGLLLPTK